MKKCKYCNGTGRSDGLKPETFITKIKPRYGTYFYSKQNNDLCSKCHGKGVK